ncbi:MAG: Serine hydroxymethyltransferase [Alphaproteobacteria bacterium MarineAlpha2_Bin1]|nr:MAG: Serine hydroxymethyltransferase [Alphaproteobacteria bacterium MarineAlpha2_Bin1]|tara:strand:+ start:686 stop:1960 length:1275 start_codon:yes stop_codon:yes gene_type:complete
MLDSVLEKNRAYLQNTDSAVFNALVGEEKRQRYGIELIASENFAFPEVLALLGSAFTNKYSEGYPGRRYYGGQEFTDIIEELARERAKKIFRAEHANVQPLSGSSMNQAIYHAYLEPGDSVLGMELSHGGHLTHGAPVSHMGKIYNFLRYKTIIDKGGVIDWDQVEDLAVKNKPKILLCGHSSYPKDLDYKKFKFIADKVGALTMADVSHIGGWIATNHLNNPLDAGFDFMTTTTHKSMRGPRGGLILSRKEHAKKIDSSIFPGLQGGPHMNQVAATAVTMKKVLTREFNDYALMVLKNAKILAEELMTEGFELVTGGTENHLIVIDTVKSIGLDGKKSEELLDEFGITTNKQVVPDDPNPPLRPSGIRLGTPALTTRGMEEKDFKIIAKWITVILKERENLNSLSGLKSDIKTFSEKFILPGI